jgi:hypothetical protein
MEDLKFVNLLITKSEKAYNRIVNDYLLHLNFHLQKNGEGDRIIVGPDSIVYTVMHRVFVWEADSNRRLVWFSLDSQIPHMSSIVACIGFPKIDSSFPLFVMNLNMKRKLGTYSTVIGFRGCAADLLSITDIIPIIDYKLPQPLFVKELPYGFKGLRLIFPLAESEPVINWSLFTAERTLSRWLDATDKATNVSLYSSKSKEYIRLYAQEMKDLHGSDGRAFDAVFGEGWVSRMFNDNVFGGQN